MNNSDGLTLDAARRQYDAIVIGSGLGGATLTLRLAQRGLSVLLVERGDYLRLPPRVPGAPVGKYLYHLLGLEDELAFVGGQTKFFGAALYRFRESDFRAVQHEAGVSPAWPFPYDELEPYYAQAEALYRVHGSTEGDPSEPRRSTPYPHPPLPHDAFVAGVVARLRRAGANIASIPRGLDYGPGRPCTLCPTCDVHSCQLDAKMDAEIAAVRPALKTERVDLLTRTDCTRVILDRGTRADGVVLTQGGSERKILAPIIAVCSGQKQTSLLLRRSRTAEHPDGLGNHSGLLGKSIAGHTTGVMFPLVSFTSIGDRHTKTFSVNTYYEGAPDWPHPTGVLQVAGQIPLWEGSSRLKRVAVEAVARRSLMCFYMTEALPTSDSGFVFEGDTIADERPPIVNIKTFGHMRRLAERTFQRAGYPVLPALRAPQLWHKTGGAVMGVDPAHSVTDPLGQVHGISGLYVTDASILPSAGAVNTGLTIIALALRAGDTMAA